MSALPTPVESKVMLSLDERRDRIVGVLEDTARRIGAELEAAKTEHPGTFVAWVENELPFGLDKAERLMAINRTFATCDPALWSSLPPRYTALYELTRLPSERLAKAIEARVVGPDSTVREVKEFVQQELEAEYEAPDFPPEPNPSHRHVAQRLSCDIVAGELMRHHRDEMSDEVADRLKEWLCSTSGS